MADASPPLFTAAPVALLRCLLPRCSTARLPPLPAAVAMAGKECVAIGSDLRFGVQLQVHHGACQAAQCASLASAALLGGCGLASGLVAAAAAAAVNKPHYLQACHRIAAGLAELAGLLSAAPLPTMPVRPRPALHGCRRRLRQTTRRSTRSMTSCSSGWRGWARMRRRCELLHFCHAVRCRAGLLFGGRTLLLLLLLLLLCPGSTLCCA